MKPRRVLHVTYALDFGGVESHLRIVAQTSGKRYSHEYCAIANGGAAADAIASAGPPIHLLGLDPWQHPITTAAGLRRLIRQLRPDVVHCHGLEGNLFGLPAAFLAGVPVRIGEEIGIPDHGLKARLTLKAVYKLARRIVVISEAVRCAVIGLGEAPARKVVRIYLPSDAAPSEPHLREAKGPLRIAFVGRLEPVKNPLRLVEAVALLPVSIPCELILIGDGGQRDELAAFIRQNQLNQRIQMAGFVEKPSSLLSRCHLYIQPSQTEGLGLAVVEAMRCGLPAAVTATGGMPEIVEDGVTGWVLPDALPEAIAQCITKAAALLPQELAAMGRAARASVERRFSPATYIREIEALYDECLA